MVIDSFSGEHEFLSNFSPSPVEVDGFWYPTVEHAFQALKSLDESERATIREASTPGRAKRLGRQVALSQDWEEVKVEVMRELLRLKFSRETKLATMLLDTGKAELVEGNHWHDTFWGVCNGEGQSVLGKLLMSVRDELILKGSLKS